MKTHWLYGYGPNKEVVFNTEIDKETECKECIHKLVCDYNMNKRCSNYSFGNSEGIGCQGCIHRFTRWDNDAIPCFYCRFFIKI